MASLQCCLDACLAQWVKESSIATEVCSSLQLISDPWPGNSMCPRADVVFEIEQGPVGLQGTSPSVSLIS